MDEPLTEKDYPIRRLWIFKSVIYLLLGLIIWIPLYLMVYSNDTKETGLQSTFVIIYSVGYVILHITVVALRRAMFHYSAEQQFLTLRQGILSRQERHIPYGVIQNVVVDQDLLDRIFGLASLTIENASQGAGAAIFPSQPPPQLRRTELVGYSGNRVSIPGLKRGNAETLKGIILQKMRENPIEDSQSGL